MFKKAARRGPGRPSWPRTQRAAQFRGNINEDSFWSETEDAGATVHPATPYARIAMKRSNIRTNQTGTDGDTTIQLTAMPK